MSAETLCHETRELLPELALGIADGEDRAQALEHVATCSDCQRELERLSGLADELLELAPEQEPPGGFELRVLDALEPPRPKARRRLFRPMALAAAALVASALTAGALLFSFRGDRRVADHYRSVLTEAHGSYFGASRFHDASGAQGGVAFVYRGAPSWVMITVDPSRRAAVARAEIVTKDGHTVPIRWFTLIDGAWGGTVPVDVSAISGVRLLAADGHPLLAAELSRNR
jgi:hypothetical protein